MEPVIMNGDIGQPNSEIPDEFERQIDAFRATWRPGFKDPELTYVLGNLRGFAAHLKRAGFELIRRPSSEH
jgi:hypothetical protein